MAKKRKSPPRELRPSGQFRLIVWTALALLCLGAGPCLWRFWSGRSAGGVKSTPIRSKAVLESDNSGVRVLASFPHAGAPGYTEGPFTQGLILSEWDKGGLHVVLESSGLYDASYLREIRLGDPLENIRVWPLPAEQFAEGIIQTPEGDVLMGTWREGVLLWLRRTAESFELVHTIRTNQPVIWGLATNGTRLWLTTGNNVLFGANLADVLAAGASGNVAQFKRDVLLTRRGQPLWNVNAMTYDERTGRLWGNVYGATYILEMDPRSGRCTKEVQLAEVDPRHDPRDNVMNGLAIHPAMPAGRLLLTGKRWDYFYLLEF